MSQLKKKDKLAKVVKDKFVSQTPEPVQALTQVGAEYLDAINSGTVIIAKGCAGVGKSYMATLRACELMQRGDFRKVVVTIPTNQLGKGLGFLPGTEEEKLSPYVKHIRSMISSHYTKGWLASQERNGNIEFVDISTIQGSTYDNSIIIADEIEHLSPMEFYIILTRIGKYSKMILNGDTRQRFGGGSSGLIDASKRLKNIDGIELIEFTSSDVVRSGIVKAIIKAYEEDV